MKVQTIQQNNIQQKNTPKFKGAGDAFLRYLATNQAVGANGVDLCFMVIPRTGSDMIRRGPLAGFETLRREIMGTINDSLIGAYGIVIGSLAAALMGFNKKYEAKVNNIFAAPETLNILAENKAAQLKGNKSQIDYLKETLKNLKAYNPASSKADAEGFGMLRREGDLKADYVADDFALWVDTADIHPTEPSYFILSGATVGENGELAGNFLRVMSDSADVEGYKADNEMTRLAFVPAKREAGATSDSLLVNYQNETLTKADSVG